MKKEDKGILINCAIRYCLGRESYMPSLVQSIVRKNIKDVDDKTLGCMERDIRERIAEHECDNPYMSLGMDTDYIGWKDFYTFIREEFDKRHLKEWI